MSNNHDRVRAVQWVQDGLQLLDQRLLPGQEVYLLLADVAAVADAIRDMVVRGAPAIGITAAYGVVLAGRDAYARAGGGWHGAMNDDLAALRASRPTAVNLFWALDRMQGCADRHAASSVPWCSVIPETTHSLGMGMPL